ncbi:hypothetical protein P8605_38485 [Streptomyces sp. T-3]|nr:hypothetical protein [Streptomyces sp. T-3]
MVGLEPAGVLGAAVAPTDATAVAALDRLLSERTLKMLKAESLINDGTGDVWLDAHYAGQEPSGPA